MKQGLWTSPQEEDAWIHTLQSLAQNHGKRRQLTSDSYMNGTEIPKIIHFIWLGPKSIPKFPFLSDSKFISECSSGGLEWNECMKSWRRHHPSKEGWQIHLWTDRDVLSATNSEKEGDTFQLHAAQMMNLQGFEHAIKLQHYALASDILRLEILNVFGGVYVDVDYWCVQSLDAINGTNDSNRDIGELLLPIQFFCGESNTGCLELNNGMMACCRSGHPIILNMMQSVKTYCTSLSSENNTTHAPQMEPVQTLLSSFLDGEALKAVKDSLNEKIPSAMDVIEHTGPGLLTRTVFRWLGERGRRRNITRLADDNDASQVMVFKRDVFHPFPNHLRKDCASKVHEFIVPEVTTAVHLWGCSWQTNT